MKGQNSDSVVNSRTDTLPEMNISRPARSLTDTHRGPSLAPSSPRLTGTSLAAFAATVTLARWRAGRFSLSGDEGGIQGGRG